ncbi:MAG: hypothetical protein ACFFD4_26000 [Candidatus Odinarchaeota archaeon]
MIEIARKISKLRRGKRAQVFMLAVLVIAVYMASMVMILGNISLKEDITGPENLGHAVSDFKREMLNQLQVLLARATKNMTASYNADAKFREFLNNYQDHAVTSMGIDLVLTLYTGSFTITSYNYSALSNIQDMGNYTSSISAKVLVQAQDVLKGHSYYDAITANYTALTKIRGNYVELVEFRYSTPARPVPYALVTSNGGTVLVATSQLDSGVYLFGNNPTGGYLNATLPNGVSVYST